MDGDSMPLYKTSDEIQEDIAYFYRRLHRLTPQTIFWPNKYSYGPAGDRILKQIELLEDAVVIYRISRGEPPLES